jgi:hypothetical protein
MKQLNKTQTIIYLLGATLMTIGAGVSLLAWSWAPYVYSVGALGFASMQMLQRYEGSNFTIRRLKRIMTISDLLLLFTGVFMFIDHDNPMGFDQITYVSYIKGNWVVLLLIAAVLQLYTTFRLGSELEKEKKA